MTNIDRLEEEFRTTRSSLVTDRLDMSFGEIMNMYQDSEIIISPEFQRLFRWTDYQKTRFIESIILGIPIPPIFVAEDEQGKWELVDGLQRISTILSFFGILKNDEGEIDTVKNNWQLVQGDIVESLEGLVKDDLPLKLQLTIKRAVCRVELLRYNSSNINLKYELFNRLNTGGSTATEQEIRNCIFRGTSTRFNDFLKKLSTNSTLMELVVPSHTQLEELYLEELVLRFISLYYSDNSDFATAISDSISKYMTTFMKVQVEKSTFNYDEAEAIFTETMTILSNLDDDRIFRMERGPFSTNIYDVIMLGIAYNLDKYRSNTQDLKNKIEELKSGSQLQTTTSSKVSSRNRNTKRIELAKEFF